MVNEPSVFEPSRFDCIKFCSVDFNDSNSGGSLTVAAFNSFFESLDNSFDSSRKKSIMDI